MIETEEEVAEPFGLPAVMSNVEDGGAGGVPDFEKLGCGGIAGIFVKGAEGFVEEEGAGLKGEGAAEGDALALTAAESRGHAFEEVIDLEHPGDLPDTGIDPSGILSADFKGKGELVEDVHGLEERAVLRDETDATGGGAPGGDVGALDEDAPGAGMAQPADDFEEGGLA